MILIIHMLLMEQSNMIEDKTSFYTLMFSSEYYLKSYIVDIH